VLDNHSYLAHPAQVLAGTAIVRANKILSARMETALAPLNLPPQRFEVLELLHNAEGGRMTLRDLGRTALYHPATVGYTIDALEKRGLVRRVPDPNDGRAVLAEITDEGHELTEKGNALMESVNFAVGELTDEDAASVAIILSRLRP
jgi:DNA-binding MarR family transcriptional regulator